LEQSSEFARFQKEAWKNATSFAWKEFDDPLIRRWFKTLSILGKAALPADKLRELNEIIADMENVYSTAKICPFGSGQSSDKSSQTAQCNLVLDPDLTRVLAKSRNYNELLYLWKAWRDKTGAEIRRKYIRYVQLMNEAARLNGFNDMGEMWRESYESETLQLDLENLWLQLKPLYEHLHAYVRSKLIELYGSNKIKANGPIPAHVLGNMWAQSWRNLQDLLLPYPQKPSVDVTAAMLKKNLTALDMFKTSEEFFTSLGLKPMTEQFWLNSILVKPKDREIVCHASAWDFCDGHDFRIKQCSEVNMRDLIVTHHEMGHIQYFQQYAKQPYVFREGANPGFHEAVGDVLALSVSTPSHLKKIGLLEEVADDEYGDLNFLMSLALDKIAFLPSGYLMDLWRWKIFDGEISFDQLNAKWWEYRFKYQGVCPAVRRSESDFDAGAKYHIAASVPYI
ncbi:Angiotensin-converting enzyme-like protein, partial [Dinothrombium tinctorium]